MKRLVVINLLLVFACLCNPGMGHAASINENQPFTWRQLSLREWQIEFVLPHLQIDSIALSGNQWADIHVDGLSNLAIPGEPALPFFSLWIPANVELEDFELVEQASHIVSSAPPLPASMPLDRNVQSSMTYVPNEAIYTQSAPYPGQLIDRIQNGSLGKSNLTQFRINPLQFVATTNSLTVYDRLLFNVSLTPGQRLDENAIYSPYEPQFISDFVHIQRPVQPPVEVSSPRMWIITQPDYVDALGAWREFKRSCGITTEIIIYSEVASNATSLKTYLQSRYNEAEVPAEFLLLIGDHQDIPAHYGVGSSLTDHPYSCLSGQDYLPDISVGRLPVQSVTQLSAWLNRALNYERDGLASESAEATVFSSSVAIDPQHGQQVNSIFQHAGLNSTALQQPQSGALPMLLGSLNEQPLWTFYIGHGSSNSWSSVSPRFTNSAFPQIQNAHPSMVVSVACATADFDETENSIAEEWTIGMLSSGALCYVGATESTAFFYSDTIGLATLEAVFERNYVSIGKALDFGKLSCAEFFPQGSGGLTEETIQQFVLFGDPSLRPYTSSPIAVTLELPTVLPVGSTHVPITVTANGLGVMNADVTLSSATSYPRIVTTDSDGFALIPLPFSTEHEWSIVVRGRNTVSQQLSLSVVPVAGPLVQLQLIELEEINGDHDGNTDRGESGTMRVLLRNSGTSPSDQAMLRLECSNTNFTFAPATIPIQAFAPQTEDWLSTSISYEVSPNAPNGATAVIQAWIGSGPNATFVGNFSITLHAPLIELDRQLLTELVGDGDGLTEAGEQLELSVIVANHGDEPLRLPIADCLPDHEYLHIQNTRWESNIIEPQQIDTINFVFNCDSATPRGYAFEYTIALNGANASEQFFMNRFRIGQVPALLYVLDSHPQQVAGIQSALEVLGTEFETTSQLPTDLSRYSSIWIFCGIHPNQEPLPAQAAHRIAEFLDDGGSCYWEGGDVWAFDYQTPLHSYFGINGLTDGYGDAGPIEGVRGRFTEGMTFTYGGENSFIDRIQAVGSAVEVLNNTRSGANYALCVANSAANYRTIGSSIEIGALQDTQAPSTRVNIVKNMLEWFGIPVLHDLTPPVITHIPIGIWHNCQQPIPVTADIQDESEIDLVSCDYQVNNGSLESVAMRSGPDGYFVQIPAHPIGTQISYRLRATDRAIPQNTTVTDEFHIVVESYADRVANLIPASESLNWMRKRGASGSVALSTGTDGKNIVLLMGNGAGRTGAYVTEVLDLNSFAVPELQFCSMLTGNNRRQPVTARILASTDGGKTFPHLLWREDLTADAQHNWIQESNLSIVAGQSEVVIKFLYYADGYWEISDAQISDAMPDTKPVRNLVVVPGEIVSLHWAPAKNDNATYRILAAPTLRDEFLPISVTQDTSYADNESKNIAQRFYRVEEFQEGRPRTSCQPARLGTFDRIANSFKRRSK